MTKTFLSQADVLPFYASQPPIVLHPEVLTDMLRAQISRDQGVKTPELEGPLKIWHLLQHGHLRHFNSKPLMQTFAALVGQFEAPRAVLSTPPVGKIPAISIPNLQGRVQTVFDLTTPITLPIPILSLPKCTPPLTKDVLAVAKTTAWFLKSAVRQDVYAIVPEGQEPTAAAKNKLCVKVMTPKDFLTEARRQQPELMITL